MNRYNIKNGKEAALLGASFLFLSLFLGSPMLMAAESSQGSGGSWFSNAKDKMASLGASARNSFSELSKADLGSGKARIRPHFSFTNGFNSNARVGDKQADAAWQARIAPGVTLALPVGDKLYNEIDYTYGVSTTQGSKTSATTSTHIINALSQYTLSPDTTIGASNNIQWSESPDRVGKTFFLETAQGQISHRFGEKLSGQILDILQYYNDPNNSFDLTAPSVVNRQMDFWDNGVKPSLTYELTEKLTISPEFTWNHRNFSEAFNRDYHQYRPAVSATYRLGAKTMLSANFGWAYRNFAKGSTVSSLVYGASATHTIGRKFVWGANYSRSLQDTFNTQFVLRQDTPEASNLDTFDTNFRVLTVDRIGTTGNFNFNEKNSVGAFLDAQFVNSDIDDNVVTGQKNDENLLETGTRYTYRLTRYLSFDIGYTFGRRFSTANTAGREEYTFHKVTGGVNLSF